MRLSRAGILEEQRGALVRGEPPGEPDRQRLGVQHLLGLLALRRRRAALLQLRAQSAPRKARQALAPPLVRAPELGVGDLLDALPHRLVGGMRHPARAEIGVEKPGHVLREPPAHVDAVGDGRDGHIVHRNGRPQSAPHAPGHARVQRADAVGGAREPDRQHGHGQRLVGVRRILAAERHELLAVQAELRAAGAK
jgi:hypothetical protein